MRNYIPAVIVAAIITFCLLWGMQALIIGGDSAFTDAPKGRVLDFVRVKQDEQVKTKERKPTKPPKPKEPPPPMEQPKIAQANPNANASAMSFDSDIVADVGLDGGLNLESSDGEYLPIVKPQPVYPQRAQSRGIEGFVIVEFVVTKNGAVRSPAVISAEPQGVFEKAALDAVLKFKYKPRVVNGEPVEVAGVQNKISFRLGS